MQSRPISATDALAVRRRGEKKKTEEEGEEGCRTVHHQISTNVTRLGFWGSPPRLAFACNPSSSVVAVRGCSGTFCRDISNVADLWRKIK